MAYNSAIFCHPERSEGSPDFCKRCGILRFAQNDSVSCCSAREARDTTDREHCCCFTGHRPQKLPWGMNENDPRCVKLKAELDARLDAIYELGYRHFVCGMAIGCDMYLPRLC